MADGASDMGAESRTAGYELALPGSADRPGGRKVLGSRDFALFYRYKRCDTLLVCSDAGGGPQLNEVTCLPIRGCCHGLTVISPAMRHHGLMRNPSNPIFCNCRQRHRPEDVRQSVAVNGVLARYRALNIATHTPTVRS